LIVVDRKTITIVDKNGMNQIVEFLL